MAHSALALFVRSAITTLHEFISHCCSSILYNEYLQDFHRMFAFHPGCGDFHEEAVNLPPRFQSSPHCMELGLTSSADIQRHWQTRALITRDVCLYAIQLTRKNLYKMLTLDQPVLLEAPLDPSRRQKNSVLLTIDLTKAVADEAIKNHNSVVVAYRMSNPLSPKTKQLPLHMSKSINPLPNTKQTQSSSAVSSPSHSPTPSKSLSFA